MNYTIYGDMMSGNCYKAALVCSLLDKPYTWKHTSILEKQTQSDEFLALNPNGKIPILCLDDGRVLSESNAIINFIAHGSDLLPTDSFELALVQQWQFFEQYSHEPFIAVARYINKYLGLPAERKQEYDSKQAGGHKALSVMNRHLAEHAYFVSDRLTVADVSLYAYTHVADEGGFDLSSYTHVLAWLNRVAEHSGYIEMS